jgi:hypothetical protein
MQSAAQNDRSADPKGRAVVTHQAKNTCPWGEEGTDSPKSKSKKILNSSSSNNTCPWGEEGTGEAQTAPRKNVAPAPWDNMQTQGGFGGQKKSGKSNQPTSLWDPEEDDSNRLGIGLGLELRLGLGSGLGSKFQCGPTRTARTLPYPYPIHDPYQGFSVDPTLTTRQSF